MSITNGLALTPPLGWNSWDCYGTTVREEEVKANADYMAAHLAQHGWNYIVVDIQWYEPAAKAGGYRPDAALITDDYGRCLPAMNRFPSAANGVGFKPLADYVHNLGLKFGIHIMRGIPRQVVRQNLPVLGTSVRGQDIADTQSMCPWNSDMFGLDMSKPGAQAYYDSLIALYAEWGVDYIKADDMLWPYHDMEIEGLHRAIQNTNRPILLSLSPGVNMTMDYAPHLKQNCEIFRISGDFWDRWEDLKNQFDLCKQWVAYSGSGCWADADMLPLGRIGIRAERGVDRQSLLTHDEQITLMTLWAMTRSPLMFGGDLPSNDEFTLKLLTNDPVLKVNQTSCENEELYRRGDHVVWKAKSSDSDDLYLALFNLSDALANAIVVDLALLDKNSNYRVYDLWDKTDLGIIHGTLRQSVPAHGAKLLGLTPVQ
ncbi:MAG: alpha-galactosidase [Chloroflexota bacterium]